MKNRLKTTATLALALTALFTSSVPAADPDDALIRRMGGTYSDNEVILRQQSPGIPDFFTTATAAITIPRGKGRIAGNLGGVVPFSGKVTDVRVSGRKVIYTGRLNLIFPGVSMRQKTFRAVASAAGPKRETLVLTFKVIGTIPPNTLTISGSFRGTK